jgi:DNA-directed RNA polymerase sigma subunit (sigma70/sigma32)
VRQRIDDMRTTKAEQLGRQPTDLEWCAAAAVPSMDELRRRRNNGRAAKERMICANMRLVVSCSKRYQNQGLALLDLWQEGNLGLIKVRARPPHSGGKVASRNVSGFGWEIAHAAIRDARRFPSPGLWPVLTCTRTPRKFGLSPSFKGRFLSPPATSADVFVAPLAYTGTLSLGRGAHGVLRQGVERYDPDRGFRLSTYVYWWIRQAITRAIAYQGRTIRLPMRTLDALYKINAEVKQYMVRRTFAHRFIRVFFVERRGSLRQFASDWLRRALWVAHGAQSENNEKEPTEEELAELTGMSVARVKTVIRASHPVASLDVLGGGIGGSSYTPNDNGVISVCPLRPS